MADSKEALAEAKRIAAVWSPDAIEVLKDIMCDHHAPEATRAQAAQTILTVSGATQQAAPGG